MTVSHPQDPGNVSCETTEEEILKFFDSADGVCGNREPSIVIAVNSVCDNGNFQGQAYPICNACAIGNCAEDGCEYEFRIAALAQAT